MEFPFISPSVTQGVQVRAHVRTHTHTHTQVCTHLSVYTLRTLHTSILLSRPNSSLNH